MVDEVSKIAAQKFSTKGMKLSEIKKENELLFNYFTKAGYKEDAIIYSSDVDKVSEQFDSNESGKLSKKELKAMLGENITLKERRAVRKTLETIKTNDLTSSEELLPEQISEHTTNYKNDKGEIVYKETVDETGSEKTYPLNGSDMKIAKKERTENGVLTTTEYLDGEVTMPSKETVNDNGDVTTTEYRYDGTRLHTSEEIHGNDVTFKKYRNSSDSFPETTLVMEYKKGAPEQFRSFENKFDTDGNRTGIVKENTGAYIKDDNGILKEEVTLIPEGYKFSSDQVKGIPDKFIQSKTVTIQKEDNSQEVQYFKNFDGKLHRIEKAEDGTEFVTVKMPKGWEISRLAYEFGIEKEDILKANKDSNGNPLWRTNSKGADYFLIDDKVKIVNPKKISDRLSDESYLWGEDAKLPVAQIKPQPKIKPENKIKIVKNKIKIVKNKIDNKTPQNKTSAAKNKKAVKIWPHKKNYPTNILAWGERRQTASKPAKITEQNPHALVKRSRLEIGENPLTSANAYNTFALYYNMSRSGQTIAAALIHHNKSNEKDILKCIDDLKYLKDIINYANSNKNIITSVPKELYAYVPRPGATKEEIRIEAAIYEYVFGIGSSGYLIKHNF